MRWKVCLVGLMLLGSSCVPVTSREAVCDATASLRDAHTSALLADGGDQSVQTGAALIAALDAGCR